MAIMIHGRETLVMNEEMDYKQPNKSSGAVLVSSLADPLSPT